MRGLVALLGSVRLGGQQLGVHVGVFAAIARRPAQLGAVRGLAFAEQQVVRFALDPLAGLEAEGPGAWSPTSGRAALPRFRWPGGNSWPRLGGTAVDLLPDVVKVVALSQC